jgi:DNA polymerase III subunit delta
MITTLTGENSFALQSALRERMDAFVAEHGDLALERVDGEEADLARIQEAVSGLPFLASKKLIVLREASRNKQFVEKFEQILGDVPETNDIIVVEPKLDKRLSYYKYLKKSTEFTEFPELDTSGLSRWLTDTAKQQSCALSPADARYLVERVGTSQQMLSNELEKLLLYNPKITRQTIDLLTDPTPQSTIFELLEAAFAGRTKQAIDLYAEQRALKVEPQQIVAMLAWQLNVLAIIKTAGDRGADQIAKEARLNPFVVRKSQGIAKNLSQGELKILVSDLLEIDRASKRTNLDIDEALQNYLIKLGN